MTSIIERAGCRDTRLTSVYLRCRERGVSATEGATPGSPQHHGFRSTFASGNGRMPAGTLVVEFCMPWLS